MVTFFVYHQKFGFAAIYSTVQVCDATTVDAYSAARPPPKKSHNTNATFLLYATWHSSA